MCIQDEIRGGRGDCAAAMRGIPSLPEFHGWGKTLLTHGGDAQARAGGAPWVPAEGPASGSGQGDPGALHTGRACPAHSRWLVILRLISHTDRFQLLEFLAGDRGETPLPTNLFSGGDGAGMLARLMVILPLTLFHSSLPLTSNPRLFVPSFTFFHPSPSLQSLS